MNKILRRISYTLGMCALAFTAVSCDNDAEELTSVEYDRLFAPTGVEIRIQDRTNIRVSWECLSDADAQSYTIELFANDPGMACEGTPESYTDITENPYVITGLAGETTYSFRIKAVGETKESNWTTTVFTTEAEQIFEDVADADVTATSVTLRWTAGEEADLITITPTEEGSTLAPVTYNVTDADIANGYVTIEGLEPETDYEAIMTLGERTRGTIEFTTSIDTGGMTLVAEGEDLAAALDAAADGEGLYLAGGEYSLGDYTLTKSISIASPAANKATIKGCFKLVEGASTLTLTNLIMDGESLESNDHVFDYDAAGTYGAVVISGCEIRNYVTGFYYVSVAASIPSITIDNCIIENIECDGGDMFDCREGYIGMLTITNSTIWNSCAGRDFIRYDNSGQGTFGGAPQILIDHCTIDGVSNSSSRRLFYVRYTGNSITFTNNIVTNIPDCGRGFSDNSSTGVPTFSGNNYYNTANLIQNDGGSAKFFDAEGMTYDPGYADAANGDFTVSHEELLYQGTGDPRWIKN